MLEFPVNSYRLSGKGLNRVLGELEEQIMERIWQSGPSNIRDVCDALNEARPISFNAVMTVMNRLAEKGLLARSGSKGNYEYSAVYSKDDFLARVSQSVTNSLIQDFGSVAVPQFLKALESADPRLLTALREALQVEKDDK